MAKIQEVDYEAIPNQAKQMRDKGKELNKEMKTCYQSVRDMHNSWYGKRYNDLAKKFNEMIPGINEILDVVIRQFPSALEQTANNYSQADRGQNVVSVSGDKASNIENLTISNDVGLKFLSKEVSDIQGNVKKNFDNAKDLMNQIESVYSRIKWQSEAADAFKNKFTKLKNQIISQFGEVQEQFISSMQATQNDIDQAEKANTVQ